MAGDFNKYAGFYKNDIAKVHVINDMTGPPEKLARYIQGAARHLELAKPSVAMADQHSILELRISLRDNSIGLKIFDMTTTKNIQESEIDITAIDSKTQIANQILAGMKDHLFAFEDEDKARVKLEEVAQAIKFNQSLLSEAKSAQKPPEPK